MPNLAAAAADLAKLLDPTRVGVGRVGRAGEPSMHACRDEGLDRVIEIAAAGKRGPARGTGHEVVLEKQPLRTAGNFLVQEPLGPRACRDVLEAMRARGPGTGRIVHL